MNFRKRYIITFLFLVYFLLYVVSPLCYAEDRLSEDSTITHAAKHNTKNIRVIWELILSKLAQKEDTEDSRPGVHFFIKKARAVLNSNNTVKAAQSECAVSSFNNLVFFEESLTPLFLLPEPIPQKGFHSSFSGLSPPHV
jgi:hypothetical protein